VLLFGPADHGPAKAGHYETDSVASAAAQDHDHGGASGQLGTIQFDTSCASVASPVFNRAVALLHSFEFGRAADGFRDTLRADPSCAMAEWGMAMAAWGNPFAVGVRPPGVVQQGREAAARARALKPSTERERAYVEAVARLYDTASTPDQNARLLAYRDAMASLSAAHPADTEAAIFHALAIAELAAASPPEPTYAEPIKAGTILEKLFAVQPNHPGLAHYIIHSYDYPALADRALEAARRYARIAPDSPHAHHMPSHTFTRVGYWQESIDANVASGDVARRQGIVGEELHAMDYRTYAYLQTGQDAKARELVAALPGVVARLSGAVQGAAPPAAAYFAIAAIRARYAVERGAWEEAQQLVPAHTDFPFTDALTHFVRGLGAARSGKTAIAAASVAALQEITTDLTKRGEAYWAEQTAIAQREASAWLTLAEGRTAEALDTMRAAAAMEDRTEKSAMTPGPLAPARELLGEMLLQLKQPAAALTEFEATLKKEPNRFRALYGAATSAAAVGDRAKARGYYGQIVKICERGDTPGRPELEEARRNLSR
jgi:tetratricopeptide (TPR) repeat protein